MSMPAEKPVKPLHYRFVPAAPKKETAPEPAKAKDRHPENWNRRGKRTNSELQKLWKESPPSSGAGASASEAVPPEAPPQRGASS